MSESSRGEALRRAQQAATAARHHERGGRTGHARAAQRRAERYYEAAGLDGDWHDEEKVRVAEADAPDSLWGFILPNGRVELSENSDRAAEVSGVTCSPDDLLTVRP